MKTIDHFEKNWEAHLEDLKNLVRIPSVSFPGFPASELKRSASLVAEILKKRGLHHVEILEVGGAPPYVYAESKQDPKKPTVLLYAHHDVQPPGREEHWKTSPFEPTVKAGPGGDRLYGRGCADDKAGVIVHSASIGSFFGAGEDLPVNVKIVIEGEEEAGSDHLPLFLETYKKKIQADLMILTDTTNFDCGVPALTIALRGLVIIDVEVRALTKTVHSGMWGGPIPDPVQALSKMLATLSDNEGRIAIPGIREMVPPVSQAEEADFKSMPYNEKDFREQVGLIPSAKILKEGPSVLAQTWRFPSLTVTAIQASSRATPNNIINDTAWARVTIRVAPGMSGEKIAQALKDHLRSQVLWGLECTLTENGVGDGWKTDPYGEHKHTFEIAERALEKGYGKKVIKIGCGGSIPFVEPFAHALGGVPALLIGVEDPYTNAHGENESLLINDLKKACLSQIYLFEALGKEFRKTSCSLQ